MKFSAIVSLSCDMGCFGPSVSSGYHKGHDKTEPKIFFLCVYFIEGRLERCAELFSGDFY